MYILNKNIDFFIKNNITISLNLIIILEYNIEYNIEYD